MPAFGVKIDAVPGRLNETWFKPEQRRPVLRPVFELCGKDHAFMPIAIRVVSEEQVQRLARCRRDRYRAVRTRH